jgi:ABC-type branched-subunit amino acid transport system ATPase component
MDGRRVLRLTDVHAFYGESHILHGVDLQVNRGEVVTLLGRNGAGRTTTLKAILGLVGRRTGSIMVNGRQAVAMPTASDRAARHRLLPRGARHLRQPDLRGEPAAAARGGQRRHEPSTRSTRCFPT